MMWTWMDGTEKKKSLAQKLFSIRSWGSLEKITFLVSESCLRRLEIIILSNKSFSGFFPNHYDQMCGHGYKKYERRKN